MNENNPALSGAVVGTTTSKLGKVKAASSAVRARGTNALDVLSPAFVPFAARWDAEADRRAQLRTPDHLKALIAAQREHNAARVMERQATAQHRIARRESKNPFSGARRAARTASKAARSHLSGTKVDLKAARKNYPDTLTRVAAKAHALHVVPAGLASYAMSTANDWAVWPAGTSLGLVALNAGALWLGRRTVTVRLDDGLSAEERRLMERLDPSYWVQHADERGLSGTLTERPEITPAGIVCGVRLDGKGWSAKKLASEADAVRALLGMKTETRMQISRGSHGDRALIVIRTRSASDGVSMIWTPDHKGIGVDEVTGEIVDVPLAGTHKLIAGVTNMGKSVSWRPWMMEAVKDPLWAGFLLDPKRLEARLWHGKIRTEGHQRGSNDEIRQAIYDGVRELIGEMQHRQEIADVTQWEPTPEYPNILAVIEEGRQILQMAKDSRWSDILDLIDDLYTLARATGIWIIWATQYPSRTNGGVTAMVSENSLTVVSLTVDSPVSDRVVYGENAAASGWEPSKLNSVPGRALVKHKDRKPNPVRLWYVTDGMVEALPQVNPWRSPASTASSAQAPAPASAPVTPPTPTQPPAPAWDPGEWLDTWSDIAHPADPAPAVRLRLVKDGDFTLAPPAAPAPVPEPRPVEPAAPATNRDRVLAAVVGGARTGRDITDRTGINKGTVSKLVKALVESGDLVKDADGMITAAPTQAGEVSA